MTVLTDKQITQILWSTPEKSAYECWLWLHKDEDGGYAVSSPSLPGLIAEGDTIPEALNSAEEAAAILIALYLDGDGIPWRSTDEPVPGGVIERRIVAHV